MAATTNISIVVEAIDQATKTLDKVKGELSGVGEAGKGIIGTLKANEEGLRNLGIGAGIGFAGMTMGINKAVDASSELSNSLVGLKSIVEGTGGDFSKAKSFINDFTKDGLVPTADAATALKNLLSRGFSLDEAAVLMDRFKDSAAFGRQSALSLGEAVKSATEGLKNENSILVDNAGVTKNVSMMWDEYAKAHGKSVKDLTVAEKRQAEYNGILAETKFQVGDAAKYTKEYSGIVALSTANTTKMWAAIGDQLKPVLGELILALQPVIKGITDFANAHPELIKWIVLGTTALLGVVAGLAAIGLVIPAIMTAVTAFGAVFGVISAPVLGVIAGIATAVYALYIGFKNNTGGIRDAWDGLMKAVTELWTKHGGGLKESIRIFWEYLQMIWRIGMDAVKLLFQTGMQSIAGTLKVITGLITGDWKMVWEGLKTIASAGINLILGIVKSVLTQLNTFIKNVFGVDIAGSISAGWESAKAKTIQVWEGIKGAVGSAVQWIVDKIQPLLTLISDVKAKADALSGYVSGKISSASSAVSSFTSSAGAKISGAYNSVSSYISGTRAMGGSVEAGKTYLINERGGEYFIPGQSGSIVPNHKLGGGGGFNFTLNMGGVTVNNEADENRLVQKIKDTLSREMRTARLGIS